MRSESAPHARAATTLRAACALALVLALLALVELSADVQRAFEPLNLAIARLAELAIGYMQVPVSRNGAVLAHPDGFSYRITWVCSGARPAALVVVALLAVPAGWRARLAGLAAAFLLLEALNLCRLVHLYWTGVVDREGFFFAHRVAWNVLFVAAVAGLVALWLVLASRLPRRTRKHRPSMHAHV